MMAIEYILQLIQGILSLYYRPPMKLWKGNDFSHVCQSVSHSVDRGCHVTITHDALDLTVQPLDPQLPDMGPHWTGTIPVPAPSRHGTSLDRNTFSARGICGHLWRPVQTCSLQEPRPPLFWGHLVAIDASTGNAFLLLSFSHECKYNTDPSFWF